MNREEALRCDGLSSLRRAQGNVPRRRERRHRRLYVSEHLPAEGEWEESAVQSSAVQCSAVQRSAVETLSHRLSFSRRPGSKSPARH